MADEGTVAHTFKMFLPIAKIDKAQQMVWGYASTPSVDLDDEIIELQAIKDALPDYMEWANIREMHQPSAVGVTKEATVDQKGLWIGVKVVDPLAWQKVVELVYKGFSIGGIVKKQIGKVISALQLVEISLVDRPANPDCRIEIVKAAKIVEGGEAVLLPVPTAEPVLDEVEKTFISRIFEKLGIGSLLSKKDTEPHGDVQYADPGYQSDGVKRYPVDTEEHIRAAWSYIHMPKNAEHYSSEDHAKVISAIESAWKDKIDPEGPPAAKKESGDTEKTATATETPLQKGMDALVEVSFAFQSLRRAQRYLMLESVVEHDPVDADRSQEAAALAVRLAALISQIATDEGHEALGMTDIDDIRFGEWNYPWDSAFFEGDTVVVEAAVKTEVQKRASSMRDHMGKAAGHLAKAVAAKGEADQHIQALHELCKGFAMKSATAKAADGFDTDTAMGHIIAAKSAMSTVDDHHEMAAHHMEKAAEGGFSAGTGEASAQPAGGAVDGISQPTEGAVPDYDPTKPYPGKSAAGKAVWDAQAAAYWRGKAEALERMPAQGTMTKARTFDMSRLGVGVSALAGGDTAKTASIMEGIEHVDMENPQSRQQAAARAIGNMITKGHGRSILTDPTFKGAAG
jgi:phage head maturation protease